MTSVQTTKLKGLALIDELCRDRTRRARDLKQENKKVLGYFCCYVPVEMLTALDMVPLRIMGNAQEPTTRADAYLETNMCSFLRSCFDLAMKGQYDFLDGVIAPISCDNVNKVFNIWAYYKPSPLNHLIIVPHMVEPTSSKFLKIEFQRLRKALERLAGTELTDGNLRQAIELHNENRSLVRELYKLRRPDPPLISGTEVLKTLVACMSIPVLEANELLREVIDEVSRRRLDRPVMKRARVLVYGPEVENEAFFKLVEGCDANIVVDDLCVGTRYYWHDVERTDDPLDGIVSRYLGKIPCPRTYHKSPGGHKADLENRYGYLGQLARESQVNAVICYIIRFCDSHEMDLPDVRDYLQNLGYPVLHLEADYNLPIEGQVTTRVQAFLETIS